MLYDPNKYMAAYLEHHYKGPSVQIVQGCCRKCLKHGKPSIFNLSTHPWSSLLGETIDPYQSAGVFHPGSQFSRSHFKKPLLNLKAPELPCKYPGTCELTCLLCNRYIVDGPGIELAQWPGFKVHVQCTSRCQHPNCQARLPDFPAYINYERSMLVCEEHQLTKGFQRMALGAYMPPLVSQCKPEVKSPADMKKTPRPVSLSRPVSPSKQVSPSKAAAVPPTKEFVKTPVKSALRPADPASKPPIPRKTDAEPAVKKTVQFKTPKKPLGKARADKFNGDKSQCITDFFKNPSAPVSLTPPPEDDQPRRFIRNKQGEIYAYWKGEFAHCLKTDAVLFKSNFSGKGKVGGARYKLDFTPPKRLFEDPA